MSNEVAHRLMERVKQLRENLGLTQEAFAERADLKYKHYQAVEAGRKVDFRFSTLVKMAHACGVEPWELLNFDSAPGALAETPVVYDPPKPKLPKKTSGAESTRRRSTRKRT